MVWRGQARFLRRTLDGHFTFLLCRDMADVRPRILAVLFDLGGTLVHEPDFGAWADRARRVNIDVDPEALSHAHLEVLMEGGSGNQSQVSGLAVVEFWRRALSRSVGKEVPETTAAKFVAACGERAAPVQVYPDTHTCLDRLRGERRFLGVISNSNSEEVVRMVLKWASILDYFECTVSSGTEGVEKPDPEIFLRTVRRIGVAPGEALYVGNQALTDAVAAQSAGLYGIWLNRGEPTHSTDPPEITCLLGVVDCVRRIEQGLTVV